MGILDSLNPMNWFKKEEPVSTSPYDAPAAVNPAPITDGVTGGRRRRKSKSKTKKHSRKSRGRK